MKKIIFILFCLIAKTSCFADTNINHQNNFPKYISLLKASTINFYSQINKGENPDQTPESKRKKRTKGLNNQFLSVTIENTLFTPVFSDDQLLIKHTILSFQYYFSHSERGPPVTSFLI